jgi:rubredoxin
MNIKEFGLYIWSDAKRRNIAILSILIIVFGSILAYRLTHQPPISPPGAKRVVICKKCRFVDVQRIVDINSGKYKCVKCGAPVGIAWKCGSCKYEYYVLDMKPDMKKMKNTMRKFEFVLRSRRCPNCKEEKNVAPMSLTEFEKEYGKR